MSKNTFPHWRKGSLVRVFRLWPNLKMVCFPGHRAISPRVLPGFSMGLTGLEPVTLRLSSACSNQLSYRPNDAPISDERSEVWR